MKKNFLFKGVSVLGAMLLLATSVMPGLQYAYAGEGNWREAEDLGTTLVYDLIYNEESWNAAYNKENSALKKYLDENWSEDAWNYKEDRPCNWNDWDTPQHRETATKFAEDSGCKQSWKGAFNAPEAQYPWVVINVPEGGIQGTISFEYQGKDTVYPWLEHATLGKYGIASIPGEFSDASFKVDTNGEGSSFDVTKFSIKITPQRVRTLEEDSEWFYIYDEESWNNAYDNESSGLRKYENSSRYEDLWNGERVSKITDMRCEFESYDIKGTTKYAEGKIKALQYGPWAGAGKNTYVEVTENEVPEFVGKKYYIKRDAFDIDDIEYGSNDLYDLYTDESCNTSADIKVKITRCSYPDFSKSWEGAFNNPGAQYPWIALGSTDGNPFYFKEAPKSFYIAFKYKHDGNTPTKIVHPRGRGVKENKSWGVADIPGEFETPEYKVDVNGVATTQFNPDNLRVLVIEDEGSEIEIPMVKYNVTYTDGIDGAVLFADVSHNNILVGSDTPAAPDTTSIAGYTFVAWTPEIAAKVTADATYTATWNCADGYHAMSNGTCDLDTNTYTVTWKNGETALETDENVAYNATPSYDGATPTKAADSSYTYSFKGWSKDGTTVVTLADEKVTENVTYTALFTSTARISSSSGGGGGSSKKSETTKTDDAKANTGDTATLDDKNAEDKNDETKTDEPKTAVDANKNGNADTAISFSQEFKDAYKFAHENGITTKDSIEEADMYGPLTRIAMAKMLSQYAINVLGKTPDTSVVVPTFPDVSAQLDADYDNGVTLAYQLGIMGIGIEEFRPFAEVTRAEFGTALSRMLFGLADGEGAEWYSTHLAKLIEEKIITNDNPNLKELRGYVMIMLMRSAQ